MRNDDPEAPLKICLVDVDHAQNNLRPIPFYHLARPLLLNPQVAWKQVIGIATRVNVVVLASSGLIKRQQLQFQLKPFFGTSLGFPSKDEHTDGNTFGYQSIRKT